MSQMDTETVRRLIEKVLDERKVARHQEVVDLVEQAIEKRRDTHRREVRELLDLEMKSGGFWEEHFKSPALRWRFRWATIAGVTALLGITGLVGLFSLYIPFKNMTDSVDRAQSEAKELKKTAESAVEDANKAKELAKTLSTDLEKKKAEMLGLSGNLADLRHLYDDILDKGNDPQLLNFLKEASFYVNSAQRFDELVQAVRNIKETDQKLAGLEQRLNGSFKIHNLKRGYLGADELSPNDMPARNAIVYNRFRGGDLATSEMDWVLEPSR